MSLADRSAPTTYLDDFTLPAGVTVQVRDGGGVSFRDSKVRSSPPSPRAWPMTPPGRRGPRRHRLGVGQAPGRGTGSFEHRAEGHRTFGAGGQGPGRPQRQGGQRGQRRGQRRCAVGRRRRSGGFQHRSRPVVRPEHHRGRRRLRGNHSDDRGHQGAHPARLLPDHRHVVHDAGGQRPFGPNGAQSESFVPSSWLSSFGGAAGGQVLSQGWSLSPANVAYVSARMEQYSVVFTDAAGAAHTYLSTGTGFTPPPDEDGVVGLDSFGRLALHATGGATYTFDAAGRLPSVVAALDDSTPASPIYEYSTDPTKPTRLVSILDPVGNRRVCLRYAGRDTCPTVSTGTRRRSWPAWSTPATRPSPRPRPTPRFRLRQRRAGPACAPPWPPTQWRPARQPTRWPPQPSPTTPPLRVANVTLASTIARPAHSYLYASPTRTQVNVAGLTQPNGYGRHVECGRRRAPAHPHRRHREVHHLHLGRRRPAPVGHCPRRAPPDHPSTTPTPPGPSPPGGPPTPTAPTPPPASRRLASPPRPARRRHRIPPPPTTPLRPGPAWPRRGGTTGPGRGPAGPWRHRAERRGHVQRRSAGEQPGRRQLVGSLGRRGHPGRHHRHLGFRRDPDRPRPALRRRQARRRRLDAACQPHRGHRCRIRQHRRRPPPHPG